MVMSALDRRSCANCGAVNIGPQEACLLCDGSLAQLDESAPSGPTVARPYEPAESTIMGKPRPTPPPPAERQPRGSQLRFFLDGHSGEVRGKRFPLHQQALIGRDVKADINLRDGQVSRRHAMILVESEGIVIRDLGSANGTLVNGRRITGSVVLKPDDLITIGASSWKLVIIRR